MIGAAAGAIGAGYSRLSRLMAAYAVGPSVSTRCPRRPSPPPLGTDAALALSCVTARWRLSYVGSIPVAWVAMTLECGNIPKAMLLVVGWSCVVVCCV
jgi:hypothetical protein